MPRRQVSVRLKNEITGEVLELPPPNALGQSSIILNGVAIESVLYSDENGGTVTLGDGRMFRAGSEFSSHVISLLGGPQ